MVVLDDATDYLWMFLIAGGLGAIGGIAFELLQIRRGQGGELEIPRFRQSRNFLDLGFLSSMILGAVAAVAISYFFTPEVQVVEAGKTVTKWEIAKLIPLSLIAGSAGGALLSAMQTSISARVSETKLESTRNIATEQLDMVEKAAKSQVSNAADMEPTSNERATVEKAAADSIESVIETAKAAISAV